MNGAFPFTAVVGQEEAKRALLLACLNPAVGGVLLAGERGCAKSVLAYGLEEVFPKRRFRTVPLNSGPDRLLGTVSAQALVRDGQVRQEPGLLEEAKGGILLADEVNLFQDGIANLLLEAVEAQTAQGAGTTLIGTMDPEEGLLRPQLLERFGLCVLVRGEKDPEKRREILRRRMDYERGEASFSKRFRQETEALRARIEKAAEALETVRVSEAALRLAADIVREAGCPGNRAEILLLETARAIAALDGSEQVDQASLREAAAYVLPHRMTRVPPEGEARQETAEAGPEEENPLRPEPEQSEEPRSEQGEAQPQRDTEAEKEEDAQRPEGRLPLKLNKETGPRKAYAGEGKRVRTKRDSRSGRMIRSAARDTGELAACDTLKEAAIHRVERGRPPGLALEIRKEDIRRQIKEGRTGATILFVVDASGSMGVRKRIRAAKSAVLSLLQDAYEKRDKVGIVTFRGRSAQVLLPPTRSIDLAKRRLARIPTGGTTPLAAGLEQAYRLLQEEELRVKQVLQYLILVTDGRSNVGIGGLDAPEAAGRLADKLGESSIRCMVLDTENPYLSVGMAKELAERMGGSYESLQRLDGVQIREITTDFVRRER